MTTDAAHAVPAVSPAPSGVDLDPDVRSVPSTRVDWRAAWLAAGVVFVLTLVCHLPLLGRAPMSGTEPHRALPAHHMVESGEWVIPVLLGRPYLAKPPLHFWIVAVFEAAAGPGEFVWRLPSAVSSALLAAALCLFTARWFGAMAGAVAGFAHLGMVVLWFQARSADIDANNTLASVLAALCVLELQFGEAARDPGRRWRWVVAAGACVGALLMLKGPAGLSPLMGVLGWASVVAWRGRDRGWLLRPATWAPLVIGGAMAGAYAAAAWWALRARSAPLDFRGTDEALYNLYPNSLARLARAALTPFALFGGSLPVSAALVVYVGARRFWAGSSARRMADALAASVVISWAVLFLTGTANPRYGYVTLPLLCPLAGAVVASVAAARPAALRPALLVVAGIYLAANVGFGAKVWPQPASRLPVVLSACAAAAVFGWLALRLRRKGDVPSRGGAFGLVLMIVLTSVPFARFINRERDRRSAYAAARSLRAVAGPDAPVVSWRVVAAQPELFYYAGVRARWGGYAPPPVQQVAGGHWVVLTRREHDAWSATAGTRLGPATLLTSNGQKYYLAWLAREGG